MVNSANTECLLCGALARGHFVLRIQPVDATDWLKRSAGVS
jgi:hypothetical protein